MSDETNAYAVVIADLKRQRDEITEMIDRLEKLGAGAVTPVSTSGPESTQKTEAQPDLGNNPFLGKSMVECVIMLLRSQRQMMSTPNIAVALERGGFAFSGGNKTNSVNSVLNRRQRKVGDVVSPKRGMWGLKEWYPNRTFKKSAENGDNKKEPESDPSASSEPEQPSERLRLVPLASSD